MKTKTNTKAGLPNQIWIGSSNSGVWATNS